MKKFLIILLALILAGAVAFMIFFPRKDETDRAFEVFEKLASNATESKLRTFLRGTDSLCISVSVDTLDGAKKYESLIKKIKSDFSVPDVKNANADLYFDFRAISAAQIGSATVNGEEVTLSAFENLDTVSLKSSLLEKNYSATTSDFASWFDGGSDIYAMASTYLPKMIKLVYLFDYAAAGYSDVVKDIVRENVEITEEKEDGNVVFSFEVTEKELDRICEAFADIIVADKKVLENMKLDVGDLAPRLRELFDKEDVSFNCSLTAEENSSTLLFADAKLTCNGEKFDFDYSFDEENDAFELIAKDAENKITFTGKSDAEYLIERNVEKDGEEMLTTSLSLDISDDEIKFKYENEPAGQKAVSYSATFAYEIGEDKVKLDILKLGIYGINLTNIQKNFGVSVEIKKNPEMPTPVGGESVTDCDFAFNSIFYVIGNKVIDMFK